MKINEIRTEKIERLDENQWEPSKKSWDWSSLPQYIKQKMASLPGAKGGIYGSTAQNIAFDRAEQQSINQAYKKMQRTWLNDLQRFSQQLANSGAGNNYAAVAKGIQGYMNQLFPRGFGQYASNVRKLINDYSVQYVKDPKATFATNGPAERLMNMAYVMLNSAQASKASTGSNAPANYNQPTSYANTSFNSDTITGVSPSLPKSSVPGVTGALNPAGAPTKKNINLPNMSFKLPTQTLKKPGPIGLAPTAPPVAAAGGKPKFKFDYKTGKPLPIAESIYQNVVSDLEADLQHIFDAVIKGK